MPLFDIPTRKTREIDNGIIKQASTKRKASTTVKGGGGLSGKISQITDMVNQFLGKYAEESILIRTESELHDYISKCIENGVIGIDTETEGLDPILDKLAGVCIYTPGEKTAYVPVNHVSYITFERVDDQLTEEQVGRELQRLVDADTKVIMFNAPFDIRVLRNQCNVYLTCYWDAYLGARLLNENESSNALKKLHQKYCLNGEGDAFKYDELFRGIKFTVIPIKVAYLYAAHDAKITYELYKFQEPYLDLNQEREDLRNVAWVFRNIEMPIVDVVCDMEDTGVDFDKEFASKLSVEYHKQAEEKLNEFYEELHKYDSVINTYKLSHPSNKLDDPINISSPTQLAILFYDILKIEPPDYKNPRGTGVDILAKMDNPLAKMILSYRKVDKLLSTYIDKMPLVINPKTGRIHCKFNQYGADTGRFSSDSPNLQNIPSHNKDIRKMFKATDGYVLMSSDYSQQEPKCLAALCKQQGDSQMYDTFMEGKDLYSEIASKSFHQPYEQCREFNVDGTTNSEGKDRRTKAKSILLGVLYGRGVPSIAEQLNCSVDEAFNIKNSVFEGFPAIKKFEDDSLYMAKNEGYVTTICGRKRRLPDLQLPQYEFKWKDGYTPDGDILDFDDIDVEVPQSKIRYYLNKLNKRFAKKKDIFEEANQDGIWIIDNSNKLADSTRQCVNARIQGSAADLSKVAMIELNRDERLKELGFRMLIPVHDEVIAECPEENAKECSELLSQIMSRAAEEILKMPIKCDVSITKCWYGEEIQL